MGEARASVPAVQRLLVACRNSVGQLHPDSSREGKIGPILEALAAPRGSVGQLHPDSSREGRIGPILGALDTMTASDVGLALPPDWALSRAQATSGTPGEPQSPAAGLAGRDASDSSSRGSEEAHPSPSTSYPSPSPSPFSPSPSPSSSSALPPFLSLSSWWIWWKGRPQDQPPPGAYLDTAPGLAVASPPSPPAPRQWARPPGPRPAITYIHIYEDDYFSVGVFCLPKSASIPLHDHPGMSVLSKLLYGSLHVRAFDWAPTGSPREHTKQNDFGAPITPPRRLARQVTDDVIEALPRDADTDTAAWPLASPPASPSSPSPSLRVLHPSSGGNIHAFTALSDCAILDVLTPPYAPGPHGTGRTCTYYHATKASPASPGPGGTPPPGTGPTGAGSPQGDLYWLEPSQPPMDFRIQEGRYRGPKAVAALPSKSAPSLASFPMWGFFRRGGMQSLQPPGQSGVWRLPLLGARV